MAGSIDPLLLTYFGHNWMTWTSTICGYNRTALCATQLITHWTLFTSELRVRSSQMDLSFYLRISHLKANFIFHLTKAFCLRFFVSHHISYNVQQLKTYIFQCIYQHIFFSLMHSNDG